MVLLPSATVFRREVWDGPAREWPPDISTADLQLYLSAAEAAWAFYYLPKPLVHWVQHRDQSGAHRGGDFGLAVIDEALRFWACWLSSRPAGLADTTSRQRAMSQLRRAQTILLKRRAAALDALTEAVNLAGPDLPGRRRLAFAARVPAPLLQVGLGAKRVAQEHSPCCTRPVPPVAAVPGKPTRYDLPRSAVIEGREPIRVVVYTVSQPGGAQISLPRSSASSMRT